MTVDELRREAKALGYNIVKIVEREKLLPCTCGCNRRGHWYGNKPENKVILVCNRCGRRASGKSEADAVRNWNQAVKSEV